MATIACFYGDKFLWLHVSLIYTDLYRSIRSIYLFVSLYLFHSDRSVSDRSLSINIQSNGHFCFFSYRQFFYTDLYRSMFHLNWPVMESDLWSLYLFPYLLICFNYIRFIDSQIVTLGLNSTSCLGELWEHFLIYHVWWPYWNPVVAPGNKEIYFLLLRMQYIGFFSKFNISAILDSVVAHSNKNSISCMYGLHLWVLYNLYIYILQLPMATSNPSESKQI